MISAARALFPLSYIATTSSLTVILIAAGLSGRGQLAADLAVAQGAMIAVFLALSANLRNLILQRSIAARAEDLLAARVLVLPALCAASYLLATHIAGVALSLCVVVIARRACEWLAEIQLNLMEVEGHRGWALANLIIQATVTGLVVVLHALDSPHAAEAMWLWALSPLCMALRPGAAKMGFSPARLGPTLRALLPHAGSSAAVGLTIYLLRIIIVAAAGRELGGFILTGIAVGSVVGTLFANVIGPSAALGSAAFGRSPLYRAGVIGLLVAGVGVLGFTFVFGAPVFWLAAGLSLLGNALMLEAQRARLRLFERQEGEALFAADVLRSVLLLVLALAASALLEPRALAAAYLADAALTWLFYASVSRPWLTASEGRWAAAWQAALAVLIVAPVFFQPRGAIFHSTGAVTDSGGVVKDLPLPVSLLACFAGIVLLGRYGRARLGTAATFVFFVCLSLATLVTADGGGYDPRKVFLLLQFMLPVFALVLGQMVDDPPAATESILRAMCWTAVAVAVVQLVLTVAVFRGSVLTHDMVIFSIYQHRQFVPVVFVGAFLAGLFAWWRVASRRWMLGAAAIVMAAYAVHSFSTLALVLLVLGMGAFVLWHRGKDASVALTVLVLATTAAALVELRHSRDFEEKYEAADPRPLVHAKELFQSGARLPENIARRLDDWVLFGSGVVESPRALLFGHAVPIDRSVATSAHNYYLDLTYNFGLLGLLPVLALAGYTVLLVVRNARRLRSDAALAGAVLIVLFIVLVDNNLKVTLRQPYSGIFSFFLWGIVLSRLGRAERSSS